MRVVIYNAHFGSMPRTYADRAAMCVEMLATMRGLATTIVMVQEAGPYLASLAQRRLGTTHAAYFRGPRPGLLTLVPHAAAELDGARVQQFPLPSAMNRKFHVVYVGSLVLVNTHLESCAANRAARARQVERIRETCRTDRLVVFGDLNGHGGKWDSYLAYPETNVTELKRRVFPQISLHARVTFEVQ
jgi:endonuclease/exonuclease/phosphatase family metal-dependent hydrolase